MTSQTVFSPMRAAVLSLSLALAFTGCKTAPDDNALNTQVQSRLFADQNLSGQAIQTATANGVVTLTGTVTSDSARSTAGNDAGQVAGVKTVVNNLAVRPSGPTSAQMTLPPPSPVATIHSPAPARSVKPSPAITQTAPVVRNPPQPQYKAPDQNQPTQSTQAQLPPPPPVIRDITLPAGSSIPVRITQNLDSASTQTGDRFTGSVASDIIVNGTTVLPQGTSVTGQVDVAQDAGHFSGNSLLTISLTSINPRGERIQISTDSYSKQGAGRGKNTAEKVGGGAAVGAILGGIFGGGKGAAIGAAAGGGVGAGANGITRGQQVQIPSETVVRFRLANSILVHLSPGNNSNGGYTQGLERRTNQ